MPRSGRRAVLLTACALSAGAFTVAALGDRSGGDQSAATEPPRRVQVAPAGPQPQLPAGWRRVRNDAGGFTVGLPPGWTARRSDRTLVLRSRDRTLAIALGADRSTPGRVATPTRYAHEAISSLRGYRDLRSSPPRRLSKSPYPGAVATATGTFRATGVRQAITLVALQRRGAATFTLLAFRSAQGPGDRAGRVVDEVVDSLHSDRPA
jgi:hypothetical protein